MKKILFSLFAIACALTASAMEANDSTLTLNEIIAMESQSSSDFNTANRLRNIWSKNTFLNISYNKTKLSSKELPTPSGLYEDEYKNDLGVGIQWGHTFNFHKNPIGNVLFIGLDYTWMDLNFNKYKKTDPFDAYEPGEFTKYLPWHDEKMTLDYGMSVGPSLTFYPFTPLKHNGSDKIRLQFYFHVGYSAFGTFIKKEKGKEDDENKFAWGHGLFTSFGGNLTWGFIGLGYEVRNDNSINMKAAKSDYDTGKMKFKQQTNRLYLQFRF